MDLTEFLPLFSGVRKLFQPDSYSTPPFVSPQDAQPGSLQPSIGDRLGGDTPDSGSPTGGLDDQVSQITKMLLDKLNTPDPNVDRLNNLYNDFPQRTNPSFLRKLGATAMTAGFGIDEGRKVLDAPFTNKLNDWVLKNKAAEQIANTDIKGQQSEMSNTVRGINSAIANEREKSQATAQLQKLQQDLDKTNQQMAVERQRADIYKTSVEGQLREKDLTLQATQLQHQIDNLLHQNQFNETVRQHNLENAAKDAGGWSDPFKIKDPNDPTKEIYVRINKRTGNTEEIKLPVSGDLSKVGTDKSSTTSAGGAQGLTTTTRSMMEGAQMLYPHIDEIRKEAADLEKRGLFGVVQSRVRNIAAKIGTTGDPGKVQENFQRFADDLAKDPIIRQTNDAAVGKFVTDLGFMASGAGRVHGQSRGGGSIQMINYMKSLLSADSSLSMFNGRLASLDSYIKGYAAGPPKPKVPTGLDKAIEDVLSGK